MDFEKVSDTTLRTQGSYQECYDFVKNALLSAGGKMKKDSLQDGKLEAAWRYGINPFGLRVTVQFRTVEDNTIEINFRGGFKDSFDTTGAGQKKATEIINSVMGRTAGTETSAGADMPPRMGSDSQMNRGKTKILAGLLAIFLGGFGAHKFYIGSWGLGLAYLASCFVIPGFSAVIAIVEAIRYFLLSEEDFNAKYNYCEIKPFEFKW